MALEWRYVNGNSLGSVVPSGSLHAVFGQGVIGGDTDYKVLALVNTSGTLTVSSVTVWTSLGSGGAAFAIALGSDGVRTPGSGDPIGGAYGTFSTPTTRATGLSVGALGPGQCVGVWLRRTLSGASQALPELNRLHAAGTQPI